MGALCQRCTMGRHENRRDTSVGYMLYHCNIRTEKELGTQLLSYGMVEWFDRIPNFRLEDDTQNAELVKHSPE